MRSLVLLVVLAMPTAACARPQYLGSESRRASSMAARAAAAARAVSLGSSRSAASSERSCLPPGVDEGTRSSTSLASVGTRTPVSERRPQMSAKPTTNTPAKSQALLRRIIAARL